MKRVLSFILVLSMILGSIGMAFADAPSVDSLTGNSKVDELVDLGLVQGYEDGTYGLDKQITRAEVATMVVRALDAEAEAEGMKGIPSMFSDMNVAHWANGYVNYSVGKGIVNGYPDGSFLPENNITYSEVAAMLVRVLGGLTEAEEKVAVWPNTYLTKAAELGILKDVSGITSYEDSAVREKVFEMVYNTYAFREIGQNTVIKAIVLENDRVEKIGKNEIVVEVIREVQRSNYVTESRFEKGDQERFTIDLRGHNVEEMLGKVYDFSLNKDGKVVQAKLDNTYEYKQGKVTNITSSKFDGYTVELDERYRGTDERIFRTYHNDKDYQYANFNRDFNEVEYARYTVKNGKVLFIDAFDFNDIRPVKEIKEVRGKDTIVAYDDVRSGGTVETTVSNARVVLVKGKEFNRGTLEDVRADDVIHEYKVGNASKYVVLQEDVVVGELERIQETTKAISVVVDGKAYELPKVASKEAVYEFEESQRFYTLEAVDAYRVLNPFRRETVRVLLDLSGKVQYIGSEVDFADYVGVATRIIDGRVRVLNSAKELNDYQGNLDTEVLASTGTTAHSNLNAIDANSLVYVKADGERLDKIIDLNKPEIVADVGNRTLEFDERYVEELDKNGDEKYASENYRLSDDTIIYVINSRGVAEVRTISEVVKAFKPGKDVKASLISEERFNDISVRGNRFAKVDHAYAVLFEGLDIAPATENAEYVKLIDFYNRTTTGRTEITVEYSNGRRETYTLSRGTEDNVDFARGHYYVIERSKENGNLVVKMEVPIFDTGVIDKIEGNLYTLKKGDKSYELYEVKATEYFGVKPKIGDKISYLTVVYKDDDYDKDLRVVIVIGRYDPAPPVVTNILEDAFISRGNTWVVINGKTYLYGGELTLSELLALKGKKVKFTSRKVDGDDVATSIEQDGVEIDEDIDVILPEGKDEKDVKVIKGEDGKTTGINVAYAANETLNGLKVKFPKDVKDVAITIGGKKQSFEDVAEIETKLGDKGITATFEDGSVTFSGDATIASYVEKYDKEITVEYDGKTYVINLEAKEEPGEGDIPEYSVEILDSNAPGKKQVFVEFKEDVDLDLYEVLVNGEIVEYDEDMEGFLVTVNDTDAKEENVVVRKK